ncbi:Uncharacterised protein [Chlamydia trachomatis]|nr:Uncharacterised protein [Chlamydia trachomatis]
METWKDLDRLEVGFPVEIYKPKAEDWVYQIPSVKNLPAIINDIMNPKNDETLDNDEGLTYSDYIQEKRKWYMYLKKSMVYL